MTPVFLSHGWLPAVLPADAVRFRVADQDLACTFQSAGAALVTSDPDVEIAQAGDLVGDAPTAIVPLEGHVGRSAPLGPVVSRLSAYVDVKHRAGVARAALERRGYTYVRTLFWDRDQPMHPDDDSPQAVRRMAERFPRRALLVASRHRPGPTLLGEAVLQSAIARKATPGEVTLLVSSGTLVVLTPHYVQRVAVGPGTGLISAQAETLRALAGVAPPAVVSTRLPGVVDAARTGLAHWSVEQRLAGEHPRTLTQRSPLFADALEFLAALYRTKATEPGQRTGESVRQADVLARYLAPAEADAVRDVARTIDELVGALRCGFWHGDFWNGNLLVQGEQLAGVIDWAQGGTHGLPLLDLLNLELIAACDPGVYQWGRAFTAHLLPRMRRGPTDAGREYLRRTGLDLTSWQHACLVAAYWLERVAFQLGAYADRGADPLWLKRNVIEVIHAITAQAVSRPSAHEWSRRAAGVAG